jgi:hypothetical protein
LTRSRRSKTQGNSLRQSVRHLWWTDVRREMRVCVVWCAAIFWIHFSSAAGDRRLLLDETWHLEWNTVLVKVTNREFVLLREQSLQGQSRRNVRIGLRINTPFNHYQQKRNALMQNFLPRASQRTNFRPFPQLIHLWVSNTGKSNPSRKRRLELTINFDWARRSTWHSLSESIVSDDWMECPLSNYTDSTRNGSFEEMKKSNFTFSSEQGLVSENKFQETENFLDKSLSMSWLRSPETRLKRTKQFSLNSLLGTSRT